MPVRRTSHARRARGQSGAATLIIVMLLFFIVSLVAAYTARNLIFEQRTSANQYRSTQAFEAAQAGVDWALSMLNSGRVDDNCLPSIDPADNTFRDRYLSAAGGDDEAIEDDGAIVLRTRAGGEPLLPSCVFDADSDTWRCSCPSDAAPALPAVASPLAQPTFRIRFIPSTVRPDLISIVSAGCTRPDPACLAADPVAPAGDAMAVVTTLIAVRGGLFTPPGAPVMAREGINAGAGPLSVTNTDRQTNGITVISGGDIEPPGPAAPPNLLLTSLPGSPPETSLAPSDPLLAGLGSGRRMFHTVFGMEPETFRLQPGAVRWDCSGGCTSADIAPLVANNPGRVIWMDGTLTVDGDIGSNAVPALLVATDTVALASGTVVGAIYSQVVDWDLGVGTAVVQGALIAENNLNGAGGQSIGYDPDVLNRLRRGRGSFVQVPGGWRDF